MKVLNRIKEVIDNLLNEKEESDYDRDVYILLKAMINASKSDGTIDKIEYTRIMEFMGDMNGIQKLFVEQELKTPLDTKAFLKEIPKGMEKQVYYMSLFAIDLDSSTEIAYLDMLAKELKLSDDVVNSIHESLDEVKSA